MKDSEIHLLWTITDEVTGKTPANAASHDRVDPRARHGDEAQKIEGSVEFGGRTRERISSVRRSKDRAGWIFELKYDGYGARVGEHKGDMKMLAGQTRLPQRPDLGVGEDQNAGWRGYPGRTGELERSQLAAVFLLFPMELKLAVLYSSRQVFHLLFGRQLLKFLVREHAERIVRQQTAGLQIHV